MDRAERIRGNRQNREEPRERDGSSENNTAAIVFGVLIHTGILAGGMFFLPLMTAHMSLPGPYVLLPGLFVAVMGAIPAYLLRNWDSFTGYSIVSVFESCILAILSGFNAIIFQAFKQLEQLNEELNMGNQTASGSSLSGSGVEELSGSMNTFNVETPIHPDLFFIVVFLLFNAPFTYYYLQRQDTDWRYLALYLIPLLIYLGMRLIFGSMLSDYAVSTAVAS